MNLTKPSQNSEEFDLTNGMSLHVADVVSEIQSSILALCEAESVFLFNIPLRIWKLLKVIVLLQRGRAEEVKDKSKKERWMLLKSDASLWLKLQNGNCDMMSFSVKLLWGFFF